MSGAVLSALEGMDFEADECEEDCEQVSEEVGPEGDAAALFLKVKVEKVETVESKGKQNKGKGKGKTNKNNVKMVVCAVCPATFVKKENTKYCDDHKRATDAMFRQLKRDIDKAEDKEEKKQKQLVHKGIAKMARDPKQADNFAKIVNRYDTDCPSPGYGMPRDAFDFVQYSRIEKLFLQATMNMDTDPFTKEEFLAWALQPKPNGGGMDLPIAQDKWAYYKRNPRLFDQDNLGKNNALRIWCPTREFKRLALGREESNNLTASMASITNVDQTDMAEMRTAASRFGFSSVLSDQWQGMGASAATGSSSFVNPHGLTSAGELTLDQNAGLSLDQLYEETQGREARPVGADRGGAAAGAAPIPSEDAAAASECDEDNPPEKKKKKQVTDFKIWATIEKEKVDREHEDRRIARSSVADGKIIRFERSDAAPPTPHRVAPTLTAHPPTQSHLTPHPPPPCPHPSSNPQICVNLRACFH